MSDPKGYYADLGVSSSASVDEIRAVYRALAKIYHPDVNKDRAAADKFRRIAEAYDTLSDLQKRARYDGAATAERAQPTPKENHTAPKSEQRIDPICCSVCGKTTAQPRLIVLRRVASYILFTHVRPFVAVYCSACAGKAAFKASAFCAAFGWWGVPWGPIHTVGAILRNAFGGERRVDAEEELLWHNTVAFLGQGKLELASGLADGLLKAGNNEIRQRATLLVGQLRDRGIKAVRLKSPWGANFGSLVGQLAVGLIVPVIAYFLLTGTGSSRSATYSPPSNYEARSSGGSTVAASPIDMCSSHPRNGSVLQGAASLSDFGHRLTIKNGAGAEAIVKVRQADTGRTVVAFFVATGKTASIEGLKDGDYRIQFAQGNAMTEDCRGLVSPTASEFRGAQTLKTETTATQIITQELTFTLYTVSGGNVRPMGISSTDFDAR